MTRLISSLVAALALTASSVALCPSVAVAQGKPAAAAGDLKKKGDEAYDARDYRTAIRLYSEAYGQSHDPKLLYNRHRAYLGMGNTVEALADLDQFIATAPPDLKAKIPGLDKIRADIASKVSTLTITSNVKGARVVLGDRVLGTTPLAGPIKVDAGKAKLEISADGYVTFTRETDLPEGGNVTVNADLVSKRNMGVLIVKSKDDVPATAAVDGKDAGATPAEVAVPAGPHKIAIRGQDGAEASSSAVLSVGERKEVTLSLNNEPGITSKWWFWTGLGVVVVGGVITVVALTTERKPDQGNFGSGQVAAPLIRWLKWKSVLSSWLGGSRRSGPCSPGAAPRRR
jgi:hypothetical protein